MESPALSLRDVPIFIPDVDNWTQPDCNYINVDDLPVLSCVSFAILMLNIRSCKKNFNQFLATFCGILSYFSCIIFTETWLTADVDNVFDIPGFYCFNVYRNRYGGGLKMYLKKLYKSKNSSRFYFCKPFV